MKKRVLYIGLVLALATTIIMPATAVAKKVPEYIDTGVVTNITPGEIKPAGHSDRWVVKDRSIEIDFDFISPGYGLEGIYTLTYHANVLVDVEGGILQAGNLQGTLVADAVDNDTALNVKGTINPAVYEQDVGVIPYPIEISEGVFTTIFLEVEEYSINVVGRWTCTSGGLGNGTFDSTLYVMICKDDYDSIYLPYDLEGHVVAGSWLNLSTIELFD